MPKGVARDTLPIQPFPIRSRTTFTIRVHGNVSSLAGGSVGTQINVEIVRPGDLESLKAFLLLGATRVNL